MLMVYFAIWTVAVPAAVVVAVAVTVVGAEEVVVVALAAFLSSLGASKMAFRTGI